MLDVSIGKLIKDKELKLRLILVLTRVMYPLPALIAQNEHQLMKYTDNHYFYAPYSTVNQKTEASLPLRFAPPCH